SVVTYTNLAYSTSLTSINATRRTCLHSVHERGPFTPRPFLVRVRTWLPRCKVVKHDAARDGLVSSGLQMEQQFNNMMDLLQQSQTMAAKNAYKPNHGSVV